MSVEEDGISNQLKEHLTSRRTVLVGGGLFALAGLVTASDNILGAMNSAIDLGTGSTISDVTRTRNEDGYRQFVVELSDESLITNVALRDSSGEVVQYADAASGATHATIQAWSGAGAVRESGEYEIIVVDEGEVVDTEPITISTGDIEITDIMMVAPGEDSQFTPLYSNFEVEISVSEGDIPVELVGAALTDGVPNPHADSEFTGWLQSGETHTFQFPFGDSVWDAYPVAVSTYGSESFDCGGSSEVASGILEFSEPGSEDVDRKELEIEYETNGEFTQGGADNGSAGCTEGNVVDWSVESSND